MLANKIGLIWWLQWVDDGGGDAFESYESEKNSPSSSSSSKHFKMSLKKLSARRKQAKIRPT